MRVLAEGYVAPQEWPEGTPVFLHRRAMPEPLPGYMVESGVRPQYENFRLSWVGRDVPYLAINVDFLGGDDELKDWTNLLVYVRLSRSDGQGIAIEGILPLAADGELPSEIGGPGDPYTIREQHLRRYLGLSNSLSSRPYGAGVVSHASDIMRDIVLGHYRPKTFLRDLLDWIYADDGHDLGRIYSTDDRFRADELEALTGSPDTISEELVRSYQIDMDVAFLDGTDPRLDAGSFSILNQSDDVESPEAEELWSAILDVGTNRSVAPPDSGYSRWGALDGSLSNDLVISDGESYRVDFLMYSAGGLYFGVDVDIGSDFALRIGDVEYLASESKDPNTASHADYWWDVAEPDWGPDRSVAVSLQRLEGEVSARTLAPPAARFKLVPHSHNGADDLTMRLSFTEEFPLSYRTLLHHAVEVERGSLLQVKRATKGSNRIWELTVSPESSEDIVISLRRGPNCDAEEAVCTPDGRMLHNAPTVIVPGP